MQQNRSPEGAVPVCDHQYHRGLSPRLPVLLRERWDLGCVHLLSRKVCMKQATKLPGAQAILQRGPLAG